MDAGFAGFGDRDASRIAHVVTKEAGLARLDYFLASHFHSDHVGGLQALAKTIEIRAFIDHGESVDKDPDGRSPYEDQLSRARGRPPLGRSSGRPAGAERSRTHHCGRPQ